MERDVLAEVQEKCQQYWNQSGICDAEVHAILSFINGRAIDAATTIAALREKVAAAEARVKELEDDLKYIADEADKGGGSWEGNQARRALAGGEGG